MDVRFIFTLTLLSYFFGNPLNATPKTVPGVVLSGGGTVPADALKWLLNRCNNGDFVALTFDDDKNETYSQQLHQTLLALNIPFNSLEIIPIGSKEAANSNEIIEKIKHAEAIFISGGNQKHYVEYWKDTKIVKAINEAAKKISIGGTSAGLAILGEFYYSAINGSTYSDEALNDPYNEYMSDIGSEFLQVPYLNNIITDSHYSERNRQGRHATFLARLSKDGKNVKGIGIDENTAVCIDEKGNATVYGEGYAFFLQQKEPPVCVPKQALISHLIVYIIKGNSNNSHTFNIPEWKGNGGNWFFWDIKEGKINAIPKQ